MARRMPIVNREELSPEHQAAYDEVAGIRGRPPEVGPSSVMIHNPVMAAQVNRLSAFLMTDIDLPEKFKRLAAIIARPVDRLPMSGTPTPPQAAGLVLMTR